MSLNYKEYQKIMQECLDISISKNADYGTEDLKKFGINGMVLRMYGKVNRLYNLTWKNQKAKVADEKLEDTAKDLINYSAYIVMMLRNHLEE